MFKKLTVFTLIALAGIASTKTTTITLAAFKAVELQKRSGLLQPAPVLTSATTDGSRTLVKGVLKSRHAAYIIQFFSNTINRNPQITEGKYFLGQINVKAGKKSFKACLPCTNAGSFISATAARVDHHELTDTSKFSLNVEVQ